MKQFLVVCLLATLVLTVAAPFALADSDETYYPTSIDSQNKSESNTSYSSDEILEEASNGKYRAVTLGEAVVIINNIAVKLINVLNMIALPMLVILFIVGALILGIGCISGNRSTRSWGSGTMVGSIFIFALIRLAPVILATVEGIMQ